jgi:dTDP-4-dehydrorhamnose reductase
MLGHKLYQIATEQGYETFGAMRQPLLSFSRFGIFNSNQIYDCVDVRQDSDIKRVAIRTRPDIIVNCAGLVKPRATDELETISINALFPHKLARLCSLTGCKLLQISTDCVFSGAQGHYTEESVPDPIDLYGRTKLLGEVRYDNHVTIRTSMIGRELGTKRNLIEWFLTQRGEVRGFTHAVFSGLTTSALSRVILKLASTDVTDLIHVASEPISKYDLLRIVKNAFHLDEITIVPSDEEKTDRSLLAPRLSALGIQVPSMNTMVEEMASENEVYQFNDSKLL